ncbi:MAG: glycosyltransferase family 39 protein [Bacteroidia bacterium]|nr:glycosyltransferase family 39 protein [Bacteroidia bacterium]
MADSNLIHRLRAWPFEQKAVLVAVLTLLAWLAGAFVDVMEVDAAQYAAMSRFMLEQDSWLELYNRGVPYLDKPPLIFWATALSFKLLGISNFAFKLPSLLFSLLTIFSTWRLARRFYQPVTAWTAALMLATCQAFFLMNQDVKTDMYLMAGILLTVWQVTAFRLDGRWWNLLLAGVGIGIGMLSKGPLGLVAPGLALGFDFVVRRDWKGLFNWRWLAVIPVVGLMLWPMCQGLWWQFGKEGIEFFFWTQSFGRITGDSEWHNSADPFFLVHTFAWAFLPWTFLLLPALWDKFKGLWQKKFRPGQGEFISLGGFILLMVALSLSRFKLPHYIFVVAPFAAILSAEWVENALNSRPKFLKVMAVALLVMALLILAGSGLLLGWAFPTPQAFWLIGGGTVLVLLGFLFSGDARQKIILPVGTAIATFNLVLNLYFYPQLLNYQSIIPAIRKVEELGFQKDRFYAYHVGGYSWEFYGGTVYHNLPDWWAVQKIMPLFDFMCLANDEGKAELDFNHVPYEIIETYDHHPAQRISGKFLNPNTRAKVVKKTYLLKVPRGFWGQ